MAKKSKKFLGVYAVKGKRGRSYGIDYIHPQTGQRVRKILKGVTSEAQAFEVRSIELADATRGAINKAYGIKATGKTVPFAAMVKAYLKWSECNKKDPQTDRQRATALVRAFKGKLMTDINPFLVEKFKRQEAKRVRKSTVDKYLSLGSQVFEKALEWQKYDGANPFKGKRFNPKRGKKPGALTAEEVVRIQDKIKHPVKRAMVAFAFYTGWRISEVCKLTWYDVDLEKGTAWLVEPKNGDTVELELDERAVAILKESERYGDHVFCRKNGKPFKGRLQRCIKNAAKRADVELPERKAWHILRRTWASMMLQNGCDVETLRVLGNWKRSDMPLWYAEAAGTEQRRAALSRLPTLADGRNVAEIQKVVSITC